ncbi:hypothetical protein HS088_TW21G00433 [Tripterygium wilfordii]|uniref:PHD-type domain-containing protein n=1 Tax=Tripterygium wilfordii TaxID=458696 RepID=A0A7J7C2F1_TRIWF|nr:uncharacterized protein LOC119988505 [Tripterygium wilfordii]KAF5728288.1 hypothetical protein HS088_TW21G00433 [Tripterygium wilfordii]
MRRSLGSSSRQRNSMHSGTKLRKKRKRLDAICENEYNRNHGETDRGTGLAGSAGAGTELRRSLRVRRMPTVLDASPSPAKKRQKIGKNDGGNVILENVKKEDRELGDSETPGGWGMRLRSRGKNVRTGVSSERTKNFEEISEINEKKGELEVAIPTMVRSKRPRKIIAVSTSTNGEEEITIGNDIEQNERDEVGVMGNKDEVEDFGSKDEEDVMGNKDEVEDFGSKDEEDMIGSKYDEATQSLEREMSCGHEEGIVDGNAGQIVEGEDGKEVSNCLKVDEGCIGDDNRETVKQSDEKAEHSCGEKDENNERIEEQVVGTLKSDLEDGGPHDSDNVLMDVEQKPFEGGNAAELDKSNLASDDSLGKSSIKQGRRCGLCGGGTDGKPPKRFVQDMGDSENEVYSGSLASDEPNYDIWDGFGDESGWLGRLLGPINDRYGIAGIWVHQHCAVWSPEVYFAGLGCLKNVRAALCRGRALKCSRCGRPGATIGCRVDRCPKTYHLPCARAEGCIFDHRKFLIACTDHRHLFQPHGNQFLKRIKKLKAKKIKLEMRKVSNDALQKDIEAEEKWLENCGEDEEFLKRESRRLHRDLLRIAPVYIGGSDSDSGKSFEGWESVAGLQDVIRCMKEVVILPLLYPEFFNNLGITPPRGVLLHGYPGTGKTLVVRALIGACARGDKRIAYFARKGADCLGKYVGDAERQLRLLFQVAEKCQPSIIFFDEIDGLAPGRTRQQDQTHSSVVSTLLALMDGLKSRGSVVVIGATNRPDAVDSALRRPGRFDREVYFPLPSVKDRAAILSLHTKRWPKPVSGLLLEWIARRTVGFAGADLQALCTQAAMIALKRNFPLQEVLSAAEERRPGAKNQPLPAFAVEESDWLEALSFSPPPCSRREAGIAAHDLVHYPLPAHLVPCLLQPFLNLLVFLHCNECLWLPPTLSKAATMVKSVIVSALDNRKMPSDHWWFHVDDLLKEADVAKEIEKRLSCLGMIIGEPGVIGSGGFITDFDEYDEFEHSTMAHSRTGLLQCGNSASRKKLGCRILVSGSPRSGQKHLASCILHCFAGNVEIQKVDLATVLQEGHGDAVQGITQILRRCASAGSCLVFMPRIDLWAVSTFHQVNEEIDFSAVNQKTDKESCAARDQAFEKEINFHPQQSKAVEAANFHCTALNASHAWNSFVEQVESICVSTSLMILGTSELPYAALPHKIGRFFSRGVTKSGQSIASDCTVPQFIAEVGVNFNRDMVVKISAAELSRDVIQPYIQLIHQRIHIRPNSSKENKTCDAIKFCTDIACYSEDRTAVGREEGRTQCPDDSSVRVPQAPDNKTLKGRSSLQLAISVFGYQVLLYPHFAELCWFTSKLKEGPFADVSGPWKTWPFNSCIVRPDNSLDKVAFAGSSSNPKGKEKSGLVRGLVAVGLSAYRGTYSSLREVTIDVRNVLELLVREINAKVEAGKDRYLYVRILSQVAYLEDVVNSWAYALQSLDRNSQMKISDAESPDKHTCVSDSVQSRSVSERSCHEFKELDDACQGPASESNGGIDEEKRDGYSLYAKSEKRVANFENGSAHKELDLDHASQDKSFHCSATNQLVDKAMNDQNGTTEHCETEKSGNAIIDINFKSVEQSNGFMSTNSIVLSDNGLCNSGELGSPRIFGSGDACYQNNGLSVTETTTRSGVNAYDPGEQIEDTNLCASHNTNASTESVVTCYYQCCSECLHILNGVMLKIFAHEWRSNGSNTTVEDVHDVVASLSVNLLSAVRKIDVDGISRSSFDKNLIQGNHQKISGIEELCACQCKSPGNGLSIPMECSCHTGDGCVNSRQNASQNTQFGHDWKFIFRDGVLVPIDSKSNIDVSVHCKFENLCLCSLIELVAMMKQPFD